MEDPNEWYREENARLKQELALSHEQHFQAMQKLKGEFCAELQALQGFIRTECSMRHGNLVIPVDTVDTNLVILLEKFAPVMRMVPAIDKVFTDADNDLPEFLYKALSEASEKVARELTERGPNPNLLESE